MLEGLRICLLQTTPSTEIVKVVFFQRRRLPGQYSIEGYFETVRTLLRPSIDAVVAEARYESRGYWKRLYNLLESRRRQGDVNHIVGDIHYVSYLMRKNRTILTVHDCGFEQRSSWLRRTLIKWLWIRIPVARVRLVTTVSEFTRSRVIAHSSCDPTRVRVVHTCISPRFAPSPKTFRTDWPVILQVGTRPNKNLERVIQALKGIQCELHIVGELTLFQRAALASTAYRNSSHLSEPELCAAYREADIVVFASTYEGFGMPIVEAQSIGRPVVTSDCASMPEIAGDAACLVDPYDVNSIRDGIHRVLSNSSYRDDLVRRGFINVKRFSPDVIAAQYLQIYNEIAGTEACAE